MRPPSTSRPTRPRSRCCMRSRPSSPGSSARVGPRDAGVGTMRCAVAWRSGASGTVSCLKLPDGKTAKQIVGALKQAGWTIGSGYGPLKESTIRIGHMGDHTVAALDQLLDLLAGLVA